MNLHGYSRKIRQGLILPGFDNAWNRTFFSRKYSPIYRSFCYLILFSRISLRQMFSIWKPDWVGLVLYFSSSSQFSFKDWLTMGGGCCLKSHFLWWHNLWRAASKATSELNVAVCTMCTLPKLDKSHTSAGSRGGFPRFPRFRGRTSVSSP